MLAGSLAAGSPFASALIRSAGLRLVRRDVRSAWRAVSGSPDRGTCLLAGRYRTTVLAGARPGRGVRYAAGVPRGAVPAAASQPRKPAGDAGRQRADGVMASLRPVCRYLLVGKVRRPSSVPCGESAAGLRRGRLITAHRRGSLCVQVRLGVRPLLPRQNVPICIARNGSDDIPGATQMADIASQPVRSANYWA
jgi:hypothetical protein